MERRTHRVALDALRHLRNPEVTGSKTGQSYAGSVEIPVLGTIFYWETVIWVGFDCFGIIEGLKCHQSI